MEDLPRATPRYSEVAYHDIFIGNAVVVVVHGQVVCPAISAAQKYDMLIIPTVMSYVLRYYEQSNYNNLLRHQ
jgi:hypothetical protein